MLKEFKEFIARGNVVDLAVAVIVGAAFTGVIKALTDNILMPIIAIVFGKPTFDDALAFQVNNANIRIGAFLTALVNFLIVAFAMFLVVKAINKMNELGEKLRKQAEDEEAEEEKTELELLTEIRDALVAGRGPSSAGGGSASS
ncbi:MAG: large conductance mechanosensitive channel protein MscL [Acidimicrobiales bacterium]